jgi:signal transduction histidine kinase
MTPTLQSEPASEVSRESVLHAIAHEIRQPLSTIESIAYYLSLVLDDDKHREQLARVQQLVEQSNWILSNGVELADSRLAAPVPIDLGELIAQTVAGRPASVDPPVKLELSADLPVVQLDPWFARALIENILGLFRQLAAEEHPTLLRTTAAGTGVEIDASTAAPGHRSIESLPPGTALSLESARHIATLHGGSCTWTIDPASGIRVRVMLP